MTASYIPPNQRAIHEAGIKALLMVQFLTILPFAFYMPLWLLIVFGVVVLWRFRVLHGELRKPPRLMLLLAVVTGAGGLVISGLNRYSLDTAVAFCLLGYLLKSLEVLRRRDAIFQIYLGFFLTGVYLLYRFDPVGGLVMVLLLISNVLALQAVTAEQHFKFGYAFRSTLIMVFMAIPVMIAGYLFFPRLPPLWHIPNDQRGAVTGMSDVLEFGTVSDLAQSNSPAFRVQFEGSLPRRDQWYWRGMTLSDFNGRVWRVTYGANSGFSRRDASLPVGEDGSATFDYTVVTENSGRRWLYFLDWPTSIAGKDITILADARGAKRTPLSNVFRYRAQSSVSVRWSENQAILEMNKRLPSTGNVALRQWAKDQRASLNSDKVFADWLMQYISTESFYYTLRPPLYTGTDNIEAFWFGDRRGFCEHYASAMAFILRSVDIPARIVGGYMGGTYVTSGNYIQVRQMEAHAWVEAWVDNRWQRFDPTAAVAPGRIERNLDDLLTQTQPSELPLVSRVARIGFVNQMAMFWDSVQYRWQVSVLDYTNDRALGWFESAFGKVSPMKLVLGLLSVLMAVALMTAILSGAISMPRPMPEPYRSLRRIERWFGKRHEGETLTQYFSRLKHEYPEAQNLDELKHMVELSLYTDQPIDRSRLRKSVRLLRYQYIATMKFR